MSSSPIFTFQTDRLPVVHGALHHCSGWSSIGRQWSKKCRFALGIAAVFISTFGAVSPIAAASAVVIATDPKTGKWHWAYWKGSNSEGEAKNKAIRLSTAMGDINPKVIASTSKRGCGAIIMFEAADRKLRFAASLAASTKQQAVRDALQKAKAAGGRYARVIKIWDDTVSKTARDVIKL